MREHAGSWSDIQPRVERAISNKVSPKRFSDNNYYLATYYLGEARAEIAAETIRYYGYLARVYPNDKGVWYIYVRRK